MKKSRDETSGQSIKQHKITKSITCLITVVSLHAEEKALIEKNRKYAKESSKSSKTYDTNFSIINNARSFVWLRVDSHRIRMMSQKRRIWWEKKFTTQNIITISKNLRSTTDQSHWRVHSTKMSMLSKNLQYASNCSKSLSHYNYTLSPSTIM